MRRYVLLFFVQVALSISLCSGQVVLQPDVISTAGESMTSASFQLDWTLGEIAIEYYGSLVSEGFHQPTTITTSTQRSVGSNNLLKVFPNPASNTVRIELEDQVLGPTKIHILNPLGQALYDDVIRQGFNSHSINVMQLPAGSYFLMITSNQITFVKKINIVR